MPLSERAVVKLSRVSLVRSNGLHVLDAVDMDIGSGQVIAVVGPSGCGKTSLLHVISDIIRPTRGDVVWEEGGDDLANRLLFTLMFQQETLLPWRNVERNVRFGLEHIGLDIHDRKARALEMVRRVGLLEFKDALPSQLSGGMRRRVQFACCIAPYPYLLLLDEPFSSLDEPTRVLLHRDILETVYSLGISVLLVTHDLGEAISLSDEVIVLSNRPARVIEKVRMPFGHDRDLISLRGTQEFKDMYAYLWSVLWREIAMKTGSGPLPLHQ